MANKRGLVYIGSTYQEFIHILLDDPIDMDFLIKNAHFIKFDYENLDKFAGCFVKSRDLRPVKTKWVTQYREFIQNTLDI